MWLIAISGGQKCLAFSVPISKILKVYRGVTALTVLRDFKNYFESDLLF